MPCAKVPRSRLRHVSRHSSQGYHRPSLVGHDDRRWGQKLMEVRSGNGEAGLTALFIRRPVLAFVLNTLIAVAGLAAFYGVEIRELPDVDRPVITVNTDFIGAAGETVDREL